MYKAKTAYAIADLDGKPCQARILTRLCNNNKTKTDNRIFMMKKFLALILVLATARLALTAVWWEVAEAGEGLLSVSLMSDENVQSVQIAQIVSSGSNFAVYPLDDYSVWVGNFGGTKQGFYDLAALGQAGYGAASGTNTTPGVFATGTLLTFTIEHTIGDVITVQNLPALGMDSYVITQASNGTPLTFDSLGIGSFQVIPEPITIALFGLGGLFIRFNASKGGI